MKKVFLIVFAVIALLPAFAQVRLPQPSPTQTIKQDFGMSSIELTYSRPGLKGRKFIGEIEPFNKVWRTGANAATHIRFNDPVEIAGHLLDSGTYVLYTIPQKDKDWTFIINRGINNWGAEGYKESDDVLRIPVKASKINPKVETLTMQFSNIKPESCDLDITWEDFAIKVPITTNIKSKLKAQVDAALLSDNKPFWVAAQYYFEYEKNNAKALDLINKAIDQNAKTNPYYMVYYKAKIQKEMGDKAGAKASAMQSITMAKVANNDSYVNQNLLLLKELK